MYKSKLEKPACSTMNAAVPTEIICPKCGSDIELWSDEDETACSTCGYTVFRHEKVVN